MNKPIKTKEIYQRELLTSRMNLLLSVIFTVVNLVMVMFDDSTGFLFSAAIPHYTSFFFAFNCGILSESYYNSYYEVYENGKYAETWQETFPFLDPSIFWTVFAISILIIIGLFLLWFFSKKHRICSVITLAYYIVDTIFLLGAAFLLGMGGINLILQLLFHAWIVYYAVLSVRAWKGIDTAPTAAEAAARVGYGANPYVGSPYGNTYGGYHDEDEEEAFEEAEEVSQEENAEPEENTDETEPE